MATEFSLQIELDTPQFNWLTENKYKLCVARQTNKSYTVIWETIDFTERATFVWSEEFRTFWARKWEEGVLVQTGCNPVPISFGQSVIIKENSSMAPATGETNSSGKFSVTNNSQHAVNVGLQSKSNGKWKACYVSPNKVGVNDKIDMTPRSVLKVWFQDKAASESMITDIEGKPIEVVYAGETDKTVSYKGNEAGAGKWQFGSLE